MSPDETMPFGDLIPNVALSANENVPLHLIVVFASAICKVELELTTKLIFPESVPRDVYNCVPVPVNRIVPVSDIVPDLSEKFPDKFNTPGLY